MVRESSRREDDGEEVSLLVVQRLALSTEQSVRETVVPKLDDLQRQLEERDRIYWVDAKARDETWRSEMQRDRDEWRAAMAARDAEMKIVMEQLAAARGAVEAIKVLGGAATAFFTLVLGWLAWIMPKN